VAYAFFEQPDPMGWARRMHELDMVPGL
jgi:hypothetical protein